MPPTRDERIGELFDAALELPPRDRSGFLRSACDDTGVREEVRSLLAADARAASFLTSPLSSPAAFSGPAALDAMIGRRIGKYTVRRLIGAGGMGVVYEVEQAQPRRTVALKLMRCGIASRESLRRFEHEIDVLGRLHHPGIAQVFDAGVHRGDGGVDVPFFAMEYVSGGRDIVTYVREAGLDRRATVDLFASVCDAVEHGHQRGVIHRDLKPGNVLVDANGRPRVIDFGVARLADDERGTIGGQTKTGEFIGTLRYMSPEQCRTTSRDVDTRSDVYALGVILYELLTGAFPYDLDTASPFEAPRVICDVDPRRPSTIDRSLRGDLETIILKALSKDRERRYASVGDLAGDVRRFLNHEAIDARRDSGWYVIGKTLRRHWLTAAVVALFVVVCAASALSLGALYRRAQSEHARTVQALGVAEQRGYFNTVALAQAALGSGEAQQLLHYLDDCPPGRRGWEWSYLRRLADTSVLTVAQGRGGGFLRDGRLLSFNHEGLVRVVNADAGAILREYACDHLVLRYAALSPDGRWLVTGGDDRMIRFWDAATGALRSEAQADEGRVVLLDFSPDGDLVVSSGFDRGVKLWSPDTGEQVGTAAEEGGANIASFSPDGRTLACGTADGRLIMWSLETQSQIWSIQAHQTRLLPPVFTADGERVATASWDTQIKVWRVSSGELLRTIECGTRVPLSISLSPDGARIAAAAQVLRVWDLATGAEQPLRLGHLGPVQMVGFSPDGRRIVSGGVDNVLKLWDARPPQEPPLLRGHEDFVRSVAVWPDGRRLASTGRDGTIRIWDVAGRTQIMQLDGHGLVDQELALGPDGVLLASGGLDGRVKIHNATTGTLVQNIETGPGAVLGLAISPDGAECASVGADGRCRLWDIGDATLNASIDVSATPLWHVAYARGGEMLVLSGEEGALYLCDRATLACTAVHGDQGATMLLQAEVSPDGRFLAAAGSDSAVRVWDMKTLTPRHVLRGHGTIVQSVAFLPDGSRLISGGFDHVINVWDPEGGTLALTLRGHKGGVPDLAVAPDGSWFASASNDGTIGLWVRGE